MAQGGGGRRPAGLQELEEAEGELWQLVRARGLQWERINPDACGALLASGARAGRLLPIIGKRRAGSSAQPRRHPTPAGPLAEPQTDAITRTDAQTDGSPPPGQGSEMHQPHERQGYVTAPAHGVSWLWRGWQKQQDKGSVTCWAPGAEEYGGEPAQAWGVEGRASHEVAADGHDRSSPSLHAWCEPSSRAPPVDTSCQVCCLLLHFWHVLIAVTSALPLACTPRIYYQAGAGGVDLRSLARGTRGQGPAG